MSYSGDGIPTLGVAQSRMFQCEASRIVGVAGRRLGKTTFAGTRAFRSAYMKRRAEVRYIAPYLKQAKEIFWEPLKRIVPRQYILKINESDLAITLLNESKIKLLGADNPNSLRGPGLDDVLFDEFADIAPETWYEVIEPALSDREGRAVFLGTPKGYNHFYDIYRMGLDPEQPDWASFSFTTAQGGRVKASIIEKARRALDFRVFRQEYEASFETMTGRVYDNFVRLQWPKGNVDARIVDRGGDLIIGMDFNVNPMTAIVMQDAGGWPQILEEIELHTSNTEEMAQDITRRYPGRRIIICPDASGNQQSANAPVGVTSHTILQSHGFYLQHDNNNPVVVDRINNVQSLLKSGDDIRRVTIHPRNERLIKALEGLTWETDKNGKSKVNKKLGLDHLADAFGYPLWQRWNVLYNLLPRVTPTSGLIHSPFGTAA